ncbi:extracellular solute-binding protein [Paenibacillus sepulcri]|uniref:Extracellular solute-binding protein n=1 Tax=Paenibacillus sepulcri TaxID=359917 RepID=A0ABS7BWR8_9BACL|nr:extracellular solute-binding protein [Paenibacillus sepulcri]
MVIWKRFRVLTAASSLMIFSMLLTLTSCNPAAESSAPPLAAEKPQITVGIYDRGSVPTAEGTVDNNRWTRWINEHSPVNVKFVPISRGDSVQKYKMLLASGKAPDLILDYEWSFLNELIANQQVLPIDDLVDRYSKDYKQLLDAYPSVRKLATEEDGNMYLIAQITGIKTNHSLLIRSDWLDALHLEQPRTAEELYEVSKAFTYQDPDGNGIKDTLGINFAGLGSLLNGQTAGGIRPIDMMFQNVGYILEDGKVIRAWDRVKAALDYEKQLFEDGLIDHNFLADSSGEKAKLDFVNGKLGIFWVSSGIEDAYPIIQSLIDKVPSAKVKAMPLPEGPFGQFNPFAKAPVQLVGAINKQAESPRDVMKFIDFIVSEEALTALRFGIEGEHYFINKEGCYQYTSREKYNREMAWTLDLYMPASRIILGKCNSLAASLNPEDPIDKDYIMIEKQGEKFSLNPALQFAYPIGNWPTLPQTLQLSINDGTKALTDIYNKAIVNPSYSVEQAVADARNAWEQSGGLAVDEYYGKWFTEKKDRVLFTKDYYSIR